MDGKQLSHINEEKDLGVIIDCDLKFHKQTAAAVKKAISCQACGVRNRNRVGHKDKVSKLEKG